MFKIQQYDIKLQLTDKYQELVRKENEPQKEKLANSLSLKRRKTFFDFSDSVNLREELMGHKKPLDSLFLNVIISEQTNLSVRQKALEVLIKNFNQRDLLIKELSRTEIVVNAQEYDVHLRILKRMRDLKIHLSNLMRDEKYSHMIEIPPNQTKTTKDKIVQTLHELNSELRSQDPLTKRRL